MSFIWGDTSYNILSGSAAENSSELQVLRGFIMSLNGGTTMLKASGNTKSEIAGISQNGLFDIISSQFSIHYYLSDKEKFMGVINNVYELLKPNGYFIVTTMNGQKVNALFNSVNKSEDTSKIE